MTIQTISTIEQFHVFTLSLASQFPHNAIMSHSPEFNTFFYNVYFREQVEEELSSVEIKLASVYPLLSVFVDAGYNIALKPTNKQGFSQATISFKPVDTPRETHCMSGEGGSIHNAVISLYLKHHLCLNEIGEWSSKVLADRKNRTYR